MAFPLVPSPKKYLPFQGRFLHRQRPYTLRYGYINAVAVVIAATAVRDIDGLAVGKFRQALVSCAVYDIFIFVVSGPRVKRFADGGSSPATLGWWNWTRIEGCRRVTVRDLFGHLVRETQEKMLKKISFILLHESYMTLKRQRQRFDGRCSNVGVGRTIIFGSPIRQGGRGRGRNSRIYLVT